MNTSWGLRKPGLVSPTLCRAWFISNDIKTNLEAPVPDKTEKGNSTFSHTESKYKSGQKIWLSKALANYNSVPSNQWEFSTVVLFPLVPSLDSKVQCTDVIRWGQNVPNRSSHFLGAEKEPLYSEKCPVFCFFSWSLPRQPQAIPQSYTARTEVSRHLKLLEKRMNLRRGGYNSKNKRMNSHFFFLSLVFDCLALNSPRKYTAEPGNHRAEFQARGQQRGSQWIRNCQRDCWEKGAQESHTTKWYTNIWAHLQAVRCGSDPKQRANGSGIRTLE